MCVIGIFTLPRKKEFGAVFICVFIAVFYGVRTFIAAMRTHHDDSHQTHTPEGGIPA